MSSRERTEGDGPEGDERAALDSTTAGQAPPGFHDAITKVRVRTSISRRKHPAAGVDAYIAKLPDDHRTAIQRVRQIVRSIAPTATEEISVTVPTFMYHGPLVSYAAARKHCSFFVRSQVLAKMMQKELAPYLAGPGTLRFSHMEPLPTPLLKAIVTARMRENEAAATRG